MGLGWSWSIRSRRRVLEHRVTGESSEKHGDELAAFDEAGEVDPFVGGVRAPAADAEGVDGGKTGSLEVVAVADAAGGAEWKVLAEVMGGLASEEGKAFDVGRLGLGRAREARAKLDGGQG